MIVTGMLGFGIAPPVLAQTLHPEAVSPSPNIASVDAAVGRLMDQGHFPGVAVAVLRDGQPVHIGAYGFANLSDRVPVSRQTVFELASLTKQMTALAVLDLAQQGLISLDDPLTDYVDGAPDGWADITINQLLSHTAGLAHRFEEKPNGEFLLNYSTEQMLDGAMATDMVAEPGTDWTYSDQGYFLLGLVIEKVTGQTYADYMQDRFFRPLGMRQTLVLDQSAIVPHLAQGYIFEDGALRRGRRVWQFELTSHFGVMSSLDDLILWEAMLADPPADLVEPIRETGAIQRQFDHGETCDDWGYARGWMATQVGDGLTVDHAGYSGTAYVRDIGRGLSVIVLTNREDNEAQISPMAIAWAALNAIDPAIPPEGYQCWQ